MFEMAVAVKERPIPFSGWEIKATLDGRKTQFRRIIKPQPGRYRSIHGRDLGILWAGKHPPCTQMPLDEALQYCPYGKPGDSSFTKFRDAEPPSDGWYWVKWDASDREVFVKLTKVPQEPQDDPVDHPVELWVWAESDKGDPESVCNDVADPLDIQWRRPGDRLWVRETWAGKECFGSYAYRADGDQQIEGRWKPSTNMPRAASRILLEITDVRIQRIQDISEKDAIAEGIRRFMCQWTFDCSSNTPELLFETAQNAFYSFWNSINADRGYGWDLNPWVWCVSFKRVEP